MAVYLIEAAGLYKIGFTSNVGARLAGLATASPVPLRLVAAAPGTARDEKALHEEFSACRHHGEWFTPNPGIVEAFRRLIEVRGWTETAPNEGGVVNEIVERSSSSLNEMLPSRVMAKPKAGRRRNGMPYYALRLYFPDGSRRDIGAGWCTKAEIERLRALALVGGEAAVRAVRRVSA